MSILAMCVKFVTRWVGRYRPELHYMRGPGPKWLEKQRASTRARRRS
jgi:hypothetical protein